MCSACCSVGGCVWERGRGPSPWRAVRGWPGGEQGRAAPIRNIVSHRRLVPAAAGPGAAVAGWGGLGLGWAEERGREEGEEDRRPPGRCIVAAEAGRRPAGTGEASPSRRPPHPSPRGGWSGPGGLVHPGVSHVWVGMVMRTFFLNLCASRVGFLLRILGRGGCSLLCTTAYPLAGFIPNSFLPVLFLTNSSCFPCPCWLVLFRFC